MYLGEKGYTIAKNQLTDRDIKNIKSELTVSPKILYQKGQSQIFLYRENDSKIYVPRFYGVAKYGKPVLKIGLGESIKVPFQESLRDYQEKIVNVYLSHVAEEGGGILEVPCGRGKTIMALNICSRLKRKTIILVHKEFLMNQWIERIQQFIPSARVGIIQGNTFDIIEKDIVIGMIQTIYHRDYPKNTFSSFGLTIIDEVHRIGSEEFSKTLTKVVTPYILGISATVERKDGLTEILYHYIGPKIYSEERSPEDTVEVRAIEYSHESETFNEVEQDFRGNVKYSTMISKLSSFLPRREFIVRLIHDLLDETDQQVMVLSHTRDLLTFIYEQLKPGIAGYYVGGMKAEELRDTESKQVVLATYAMAAEALDIKTLNTLFMVTPKTDVIQSVGRILRTHGENKIVVDLVDRHDVFQNQWRKRKTFYKKSNYPIRFIKSTEYTDMHVDHRWKTIEKSKSVCMVPNIT